MSRKIRLPRTIWWDSRDNCVRMIDQTLLPFDLKIIKVRDYRAMQTCIKDMKVRGAPAIGAAGAFGMALAAVRYRGTGLLMQLKKVASYLSGTRPTAVNLSWAISRVLKAAEGAKDVKEAVMKEALKIAEEDERTNRLIGRNGSSLIKNGYTVQTHCNAGSLATVYYGTALGVIYSAWEQGRNFQVIVDETRPRLQGSSLTAWELSYCKIPYILITDNMAAYFMKKVGVDLVIVGADRIAGNGDVANKIGTYSLAIVAREHGVPFYVAAPTSTIDIKAGSGAEIPIEERSAEEVLYVRGTRIAPEKAKVWNPAFDITPVRYITGMITEKGIVKAGEVASLVG